ncbi:MAG: translational GTPase TypA [Patescibacteria group bacterium]
MEIRNIAIIAHVDHGKTALTDAILKQTGAAKEGVTMDTNALEQERGITIYAKNAAVEYKGTKINIVDTPGHADFGSEVERVLRSIDSVLLVVDAQEGPMPQTRFVLKKSLELGLKPIVVLNKIDKPAANPARAHDQVLELFLELGATDEQSDFPVVYAIGRDGRASLTPDDLLMGDTKASMDLTALLDLILEKVPSSAKATEGEPATAQPFNLAYDNFLGRLAIVRIYYGTFRPNQNVFIKKTDGTTRTGRTTKVFTFRGLERVEVEEASAGDIVLIAGLPDIYIGETITTDQNSAPLPAIAVDEPTIALNFLVNNSPFAGKEGKYVTNRQLRDRLMRELEVNVGLRIDFSNSDYFSVSGRGELHIAVLLENMRREGYELQVSQPQVIFRKEDDGGLREPYEEVIIDTPSEFQGAIIEKLGQRAFVLQNLTQHGNTVRLTLLGPTRGLLGYKNMFIIDTKGEGILSSRFIGFKPYAGEIKKRQVGSMISMASGKSLGYALWYLQDRGQLYIKPATEVYEGMVIGNTAKGEEMMVNPTKGKAQSNVRTSSMDEAITLVPIFDLTIERGMEIMGDDEYLEITPLSVRLRKQFLTENDRAKARR